MCTSACNDTSFTSSSFFHDIFSYQIILLVLIKLWSPLSTKHAIFFQKILKYCAGFRGVLCCHQYKIIFSLVVWNTIVPICNLYRYAKQTFALARYKIDAIFSDFLTEVLFCQVVTNRSSHQRLSLRKDVLRNVVKFTGKHLCQSLFLNKVAGLRPRFYRPPLGDCFYITSF